MGDQRSFHEAIEHYKKVALAFAPLIQRGLLDEGEVRDAIERDVFCGATAHLPQDQQWALLDRLLLMLAQAVDAKELGAIRDIKIAIRAMIVARKPAAEIKLACFRVADGRLSSKDVEQTYRTEVAEIALHFKTRNMKRAG